MGKSEGAEEGRLICANSQSLGAESSPSNTGSELGSIESGFPSGGHRESDEVASGCRSAANRYTMVPFSRRRKNSD
jgi:hypothetical protein